MQTLGKTHWLWASLSALTVLMAATTGHAMKPLSENELSGVTGEGIAIGFEDLRIRAGATTYLEYTGTTGTGNFERADARYFGMSLSGDTPVTSWGGLCGSGINNMGCPIGDQIDYFAAFDNPYILRAFDNPGIKYNGVLETRTVLELLGPTQQTPWRLASWAELEVGYDPVGGTNSALHQGQMMISNATFTSEDGSAALGNNQKLRIVKHSNPADPTVGFIWENHFSGDFRYSVAQTFISPDSKGAIPFFEDIEGFYALNIETYFPIGQQHYQSLTLDDAGGGNFKISLTQIPDTVAVYSDFYSLAVADSINAGYTRTNRPDRYFETHGFFRVGSPGTTNNTGTLTPTGTKTTDVSDGIFFVGSPSASTFQAYAERPDIRPDDTPGAPVNYSYSGLSRVNIGDVNIQGLTVHGMEMTTCSAGSTSPC